MARAQATTDHNVIRSWIETRNGHPSIVRATQGRKPGNAGLLRVDFNEPEESLEEINWDDFFDTFDSNELAFLYQDTTTTGKESRFHKFVKRAAVDDSGEDSGEDETRESSKSSRRQAAGKGGGARQASPSEEEEMEEIDEEDIEDEDEDEDEEEEEEEDEDEEEEEAKPRRKKR